MGKPFSTASPNKGSSWLKNIGRKAIALTAAVATLAVGFTGTANAVQSAGGAKGMPGWSSTSAFKVNFPNGQYRYGETGMGPVTIIDGRYAYCMQADVEYNGTTTGDWVNLTDDTSKRLAWIADKYNGNPDDYIQAAIAYLIHEKIDDTGQIFLDAFAKSGLRDNASWDQVVTTANNLWNESATNIPTTINAEVKYTSGKKAGTVNPGIKNGNGNWINGVAYTVTLDGPATWNDTGSQTYTGTTNGAEQHIPWTASGTGTVNYTVSYKAPRGAKLAAQNSQNLFRASDPETVSSVASFKVEKDFQPTVSTEVSSKQVNKGDVVADKVTSGVSTGDNWVGNTTVRARGYYYVLNAEKANSLTVFAKNANESISSYLNRVNAQYGSPVATGVTTFTGSGQTNTVRAQTADGKDYVSPADGKIGVWVWTIDKNDQDNASKDLIHADFIHEFGQTSESTAQPAQPTHDSIVLEQYTGLNKDIMDTITIGGLPSDYGTYKGSNAYGFDADAKAKIRVWWAGSGTGNRQQDETYKPNTATEPTADEHHKLIGEWEVPAGNGVYKVGGGRITFRENNTGDAKIVATGVNIMAKEAGQTGYYVFVYDFPGSARAKAFKSDYDDPWERSFVEATSNTVDLTTDVSKTEVGQNEEFYDTAHITGTVPRGSYVVFTAYDAVSGSPDTSVNKLLDEVRVNVTDEQADASATKAFDVTSPKARTSKVGNVYWQAQLFNNKNEPLASHPLGLENETVIVRGVTVSTQVSSAIVYPGEPFHDTATITGKLSDGAYVTFDAYGPADTYADGLPKLLDSAKVTIPADKIASSDWGKTLTVDSPNITAPKSGNVYWVATVHAKDGSVLATHEPGITGETVRVLKQGITTHVSSTSAGFGEDFSDSAEISGVVQEGDYVIFRAYNPVSGKPDTNAGLLLKDSKVVLTAAQAKASQTGSVTVKSQPVNTGKAGKVYWQAELHAKDGTLLATHELGLPEETVTVTAPRITTHVSTLIAGLGEQFSDKATITGSVLKGSKVRFTAYKAVNGNPDTKAGVLYTKTVAISDEQAAASREQDITVDSGLTSSDKAGKVYWLAELLDPSDTVIASHELGLPDETVTVLPPSITTHVSTTAAGLDQPFSDKATVTGRVLAGSTVRFTAYNPVNGEPDTKAGVLYTETVKITDDQANKSGTTPFTVTSKTTHTGTAGKVYWLAELLDPNGTVIAKHDLGLPEETVTVTPPTITTHVSATSVGLDQPFSDTAQVSGTVLKGSSVRFTAYNPVNGDPDVKAGVLYTETVKITDEQASKSGTTPFTVKSKTTHTGTAGKVYWLAELLNPDGKVIAKHDLGLPEETVTVNPPTITTHVSSTEVGRGQEFSDKATVTGKVLEGSKIRFTAYNPVDLDPDTKAGVLYTQTVPVTAEQAKNSMTTPFTVSSGTTSTMTVGNVYWLAELLDPNGKVIAKHDLGLPEETVRVYPAKITTQVTRPTAKPGEEFADKATISGKVERGSYVTFTAYQPVPDDPDTTVGKLLDAVKVMVSDKDADASGKTDFTVTSPMVKTDQSGAVYWMAELHAPDGTVIAKHELGLPSETTFIQPGGIVTSNAQKLGATGEQLYDEITVYDETTAVESADGIVHEGQGNSNPTGVIGRIPQHSTVTVEMYRQSTEDNGDQGMFKIAEKTVTLDTTQMTAIKEGQTGNRPGKLTVKVTDPKFKTDKAGMIYWKTTLKTSNGAILDQHMYGEWNTDHKTGYKSYERTPVQKYSTTVSKKWLSDADGKYEDSTLQVYDVLHQTGYEPFNDSYRVGNTAQTPDGATMQFEIWSKDGKNKGKMVKSFDATTLPKLNRLGTGKEPDAQHPDAGDDTLDNYQNVKSQTFTIPAEWDASKYYYRVKITVPTTTPGTGNDTDKNRDVVWYGDYDESEAFDVIHVDTTTVEPLWVDGMNVADTITLKGNIPAGMQYEAELWRTSKDGQPRANADTTYDDSDHKGIASEKVATTGRQNVPENAIGAHLNGVSFQTVPVKSPGVGSYIWRVKLYSPEQAHDSKNGTGTGGDTTMPTQSGVITGEWMAKAGASQYKDDPQGGDHWQQATVKQAGVGDGYADRWLVFDGRNVDAEKFEVIRIDTDVTGTTGMHTVDDAHYTDVTNGADVNDHAIINGYMLDGYQLGFDLYKQASGDNTNADTRVDSIKPVELTEALKELDSAKLHISEPGDYYWVTVFSKKDGTAFQPDKITESRSDKRVKSESFHAVRITTTTAKWTSKGGEAKDVALIEGCLPSKATANFELHDYETGDKVAETGDTTLEQLGYKPCTDGNTSQTVESQTVTVPAAKDHYFVESVRFPNEDTEFHRGNDKVPNESTRTIEATTETSVEHTLGTAVSDATDLTNIKYSTTDGKDIRDDLTGPLTASWEVWKQGSGDEKTDTKITTLADGDQAIKLEGGQTMVDSPEYKFAQTGIFYYRVVIKDENGQTVKYGAAREPSETVHIIKAESTTDKVIEEGAKLYDKVTITGPVVEGTMISWKVLNTGKGDATTDQTVASWDTPANGAYIITADDAAQALKNGTITVTSPKAYVNGKAGDRPYFVFSLTSPKRDTTTGEPVKPVKDSRGVWTMDHLNVNSILPIDQQSVEQSEAPVDGDTTVAQSDPTPFYTDVARNPDETSSIIRIATTASTHDATVGDSIHDTATITGYVPDGYCVKFEYWSQDDSDDVTQDKLTTTTDCVTVPAGATSVDSPDITAKEEGTFYWRERLIPAKDKDKPTDQVKTITYGQPRVPDETVKVAPLAKTGVSIGGVIGLFGALLLVSGGSMLLSNMTRRRRYAGHGAHRASH